MKKNHLTAKTVIKLFSIVHQVNNLREIQALRRLSPHEHIITLEEVLYDQPTGRLALVFELMDANLYELIRGMALSLCYSLVNLLNHFLFRASTLFESTFNKIIHVAAHEIFGPHA